MGSVIGAIAGPVLGAVGGQGATAGAAETAEANIAFLESQGAKGAGLITEAEQRGRQIAGGIPEAAITPIQPFADVGRQAFQTGREGILAGRTTGPLADIIAASGRRATEGVRGLSTSDAISQEIARRANIAGQSFVPGVQRQLIGLGQQGLGAAGDIGAIRARQAETIGDIARQAGAARASALIGQTPQIAQQLQTGQEARILGGISQQQLGTNLAEQAALLAGRN